jgi:hypothetical protein
VPTKKDAEDLKWIVNQMEQNCREKYFQRTLEKEMAQANFDAKKIRDVVTADYADARGVSISAAAAWFASAFSEIEASAEQKAMSISMEAEEKTKKEVKEQAKNKAEEKAAAAAAKQAEEDATADAFAAMLLGEGKDGPTDPLVMMSPKMIEVLRLKSKLARKNTKKK